jgi:hypothetical protein
VHTLPIDRWGVSCLDVFPIRLAVHVGGEVHIQATKSSCSYPKIRGGGLNFSAWIFSPVTVYARSLRWADTTPPCRCRRGTQVTLTIDPACWWSKFVSTTPRARTPPWHHWIAAFVLPWR